MIWTLRKTAKSLFYGAGVLFAESMMYAVDDYMHPDPLTKFIKYGTLLCAAGAALCGLHVTKAAEKQEISAMIDSIGQNDVSDDKWKNIPQVY